jgi:hypothetical protein
LCSFFVSFSFSAWLVCVSFPFLFGHVPF